jgi:hypothetical protein
LVLVALFASLATVANAYFPNGGVAGTVLGLGTTGGVALTLGATAFTLTPAGLVAIAIGIAGAAIVKANFIANIAYRASENREKRSVNAEMEATALAKIDRYFTSVSDIDADDCGKRLVCEIEALPEEGRTYEEKLIAGLFGDNNVIDPASAKAEYDLAAYLGATTQSKIACARRYHKCPVDRKTIMQALHKSRGQ